MGSASNVVLVFSGGFERVRARTRTWFSLIGVMYSNLGFCLAAAIAATKLSRSVTAAPRRIRLVQQLCWQRPVLEHSSKFGEVCSGELRNVLTSIVDCSLFGLVAKGHHTRACVW
jgi:hypothetical protein